MMPTASCSLTASPPLGVSAGLDDNQLMDRARTGDEDAFFELVRRYRNPMVNYIGRLLGDPDTAADLTQEVFVKVYRYRQRYDSRQKFSTWLYRIATNTAIDELRKRRRRVRTFPTLVDAPSTDPDPTSPGDTLACDRPGPEAAVLSGETMTRILDALAELPAGQREVFLLKEMERLPIEEIGQITGIRSGTVKSRLFRARAFLQQRLLPYLQGGRS